MKGVFLGFIKTVDTVPHRILMDKVLKCGMSGFTGSWLKKWLNGSAQRTVVNGGIAGWWLVSRGIPQSSILEPVLFYIFFNNLDWGLNAPLVTLLIRQNWELECFEGQEALLWDLDILEHWTMINGMKFNKLKCWIPHLGWSNTGYKYKLGEGRLESRPAERYLGVLVDSSLCESADCALAAKKENHILECIKHGITS